MSFLRVDGAELYYQTRGSGPLMLLIPGASGDATIFEAVAEHLSEHYAVVTYDRRGFSRSRLDRQQSREGRLEADARDVCALIEHLSDAPATVFGTSSGAVVALEAFIRHRQVIGTLVPYEPAAIWLLPDAQRWLDFISEVYNLYRHSGVEPARKKFLERIFATSDWEVMARARDIERNEYVAPNASYWFEHELRQYPFAELDLDVLKQSTDHIVLAVGRDSRGYPAYEVNVELSRRLDLEVLELPGGHAGYARYPTEFARELIVHLRGRAVSAAAGAAYRR